MADAEGDCKETAASPPHKWAKITGAAKYDTKYQQKWEKQFPFVSHSTTNKALLSML